MMQAHDDQPLVARVHELVGSLSVEAFGLPREVREAAPLERFAGSARRSGLRLTRFDAPLTVALQGVGEGRPLLTQAPGDAVVLITDVAGELVCVEDGAGGREWLGEEALLRRLGLDHSGVEQTWLAPEARVDEPKGSHAASWRQALALVAPERRDLGAIVVYAMGVGLLSLALPLAVQTLVNTVAFGTLLQPIVILTLLLAAGLIFAAVLRGLQAWVVEVVQRRLFVRVVSALADRLPRVHVSAFDRAHGPELVNRFFDLFLAQKALSSLLLGGVESLLTVLVGLLVLAFYHPVLLAFGGFILLGAAAVFWGLGRGAGKSAITESKAKYAVAGWLEEMARHLFALKLAGGAEFARRRLDRLAADWIGARQAHFRVVFRQLMGALALQVAASATLLGVGGWLVVVRELTIGQLVAAELIVTAVVASISKIGGKLEAAYDLLASADKLDVLLTLPVERHNGEALPPAAGGAQIELRALTNRMGHFADLNQVIESGARFAITGPPPATAALVDLLFGMRDPAQGAILVDGHDVRDLRLEALRARVAVVREPEVFPGTIGDNVRVAGRPIPAAEIWRALDAVGLGARVRTWPEGLRTEVTTDGAPLDRLDALRLTLARAIAAAPSLLILDRVLDQLPAEARGAVLDSFDAECTVVLVAHEPDLIERCAGHLDLTESKRSVRR